MVDDIVILAVQGGNDFFCIINGRLTPESCLAVCTAYARTGARLSTVAANEDD
jgi:hypothetical protein